MHFSIIIENTYNLYFYINTVQFQLDDELPKYLCRLCSSRLIHCFKFKQQCESTQKKLQDLLSMASMAIIDNHTHEHESTDYKLEVETNVDECPSYLETFSSDDGTAFVKDEGDQGIAVKDSEQEQQAERTHANAKQFNENKKKKIKYKCDICRKSYRKKGGIEKHLRNAHSMAHNMLQCEYCEEWFKKKAKFDLHVGKHEKPFKCEFCSKQFSFMANKRRHIREIHEQQKPFQCSYCSQTFSQKTALQNHHASIHTSVRTHHCDVCVKSYATKAILALHKRTHLPGFVQPKKEKRIFPRPAGTICQFCGKLVSHVLYNSHIETHNEHRPYKCDICEKTFKTKMVLYSHSKTHAERRFKCNLCDMTFVQSTHLKTHQMVHTGEKPFQCEFCGKEFALKTNYVTHRRLHTGEKPFQCKQCTDCFIDLNGLKRHRKKIHESL